MHRISAIRAVLRNLARSEHGFAMPTALMAVVVGLGFGGAAVIASIYAQGGSVRDAGGKDALAHADTGVQTALYRQNKIATSASSPCVVMSGGSLNAGAAQVDGWCPTQTSGDGTWTYRTKPWTTVGTTQTGIKRQFQVVAVGTSNGVSRRIAVTASSRTGVNVMGGHGAVGKDKVSILGSGEIGNMANPTDAASNGDIMTAGNGKLCGNAQYGEGHQFIGGNQCPGYTSGPTTINLPPVDPGSVWETNDNGRFFAQDVKQGSVTWNAATRTLTMNGNARLTLGGRNYSLCKLDMGGGSELIVAQGAIVNLFFHSPETCAAGTGQPVSTFTSQIAMNGNPRIGTTSGNSGDLRIMMVGSTTIATSATFQGNPSAGGNNFTLYAPNTDITLQGSPEYRGAVVGKTLTVAGNAKLFVDQGSLGADLPVSINYTRDRYVECIGATMPSPPSNNC